MRIETLEVIDILENMKCFGKCLIEDDRIIFDDGDTESWAIVFFDDKSQIIIGTHSAYCKLKDKFPFISQLSSLSKDKLIEANSVNQRNDLGKHEA